MILSKWRGYTHTELSVLPQVKDSRISDQNEGSFNDLLDWMPKKYRVGPWCRLAPLYIICMCLAVATMQPDHILPDPNQTNTLNHNAYSIEWCCHLLIFGTVWYILWSMCTTSNIMPGLISKPLGLTILSFYTMQSWCMIGIIHTVAVVYPFVNEDSEYASWLNTIHHMLQFPVLASATCTSVVFNLAVIPAIMFSNMFNQDIKKQLIDLVCDHRVIQVHVMNLPYAFMGAFLSSSWSRSLGENLGDDSYFTFRSFTFEDVWFGLVLTVGYALFYVLLLDRMGLGWYHVLFSPRVWYCVGTWTIFFGFYCGNFLLWNKVVDWLVQ